MLTILTLLKPHLLKSWNRLFHRQGDRRDTRKALALLALSALMLFSIFAGLNSFLLQLRHYPPIQTFIATRIITVTATGLFALFMVSTFITALSQFYGARNQQLLQSLPLTNFQLFLARLVETGFSASWMFFLLISPCVLALYSALDLTIYFIPVVFTVVLLLLTIVTTLSVVTATLVTCVAPYGRIRELFVLGVVGTICYLLFSSNISPPKYAPENYHLQKMLLLFSLANTDFPTWLPSTWGADIIKSYVNRKTESVLWAGVLLAITPLGGIALGYLTFDLFANRCYGVGFTESARHRRRHSRALASVGRWLLPIPSQFRAILFKELRSFTRDTTQSVQLILLLLLTFIYLYNFRALQSISAIRPEGQEWWSAILCVSNVALGACIVSAIATRFVFPTVSLEGASYSILRHAPLSVQSLLWSKFCSWFIPVATLATTLIVSGAWAVGVPSNAAILCVLISVALSIGIVGLAIGIGSVYARFDWDSPNEIAASFGSLVYMFTSLGLLLISIIPTTLLIMLVSVPMLSGELGDFDFSLLFSATLTLVFSINISATRRAIDAGTQALLQRER